MNDTAAWEPPTGRYEVRVGATMLHHLGLGPEPTEDYYAFKCKLATDTTFLPLLVSKPPECCPSVPTIRSIQATVIRREYTQHSHQ